MRQHDLVEGPLHVEHHGLELAVAGHALDDPRGVVELGQPHRLRQPPGRVDGQDDDLAAALGGPQADRRRGGGLADAAGPAAHDDPGLRVVDQLVHGEPAAAGARAALSGGAGPPAHAAP